MVNKRILLSFDSVAIFFFLLGVFLKQFYLFSSGSAQIGDVLMIGGCVLYLAQRKVQIEKNDFLFFFFIVAIFVVNVIYAIVCSDFGFVSVCYYYVYVVIIYFAFCKMNDNKNLISKLTVILKVDIICQGAIYLLGMGKWYLNVRYMGTFNDPNQYSFFLFSSALLIVMFSMILKKKYAFVWAIISFALVLPAASTGILVGYITLFVFCVFAIENDSAVEKVFLLLLIAVVVLIILLISFDILPVPDFILNSRMFGRFSNKIMLLDMSSSSDKSILVERGWDRLIEHPTVILYGSGEHALSRFGGSNMEIHSSILGPLFYYGIIPYLAFVFWYVTRFLSVNQKYLFIYIAMLVESMVLNNLRQPLFWVLLAMMSSTYLRKNQKE